MLLEIDGTILVIIISFILFVIAMQLVFYGPISKIRKERQSYIDDKNHLANSSIQKAESLKNQHKAKIVQARVDSSKEVSNTVLEANKEKNSDLDKVNKEIAQQISVAREEISKDKANTKSELKPDVLSLAQMISTKVLGEEIPITGVNTNMIDNILNG